VNSRGSSPAVGRFAPSGLPSLFPRLIEMIPFDILKFFPLSLFEEFRGGVGIVADDFAAGMLANLLLRALIVVGLIPLSFPW